GLLVEDPNDGKPIIRLGESQAVRAVYRGERPVRVRQAPIRAVALDKPRRNAGRNLAVEGLDADVRARFEALRAWRRDRAVEQRVPPYVIFQDKTLVEIALNEPHSLDALGRIAGVGAGKLERYGKGVLEALAAAP
ncbi:HRDC domain-containing protein, partial [Brevundimonas naejangsanensis]